MSEEESDRKEGGTGTTTVSDSREEKYADSAHKKTVYDYGILLRVYIFIEGALKNTSFAQTQLLQ